jgi:hypothetical protein
MEIFGRDVEPGLVTIGMGVRPHHDPRLRDTFERVPLEIDATEPHDYEVEWRPDGITWTVDGRTVLERAESPAYAMQLMLGLYAFEALESGEPPLAFVVDRVTGQPLETGERR